MESPYDKSSKNAVVAQTDEMFRYAVALHQQGQLAPAHAIYEKVLQNDPNHFDTLHLLGLIAAQNKNYNKAAELMGKAIDICPNNAAFHSNRGIALKELGQLDAAVVSFTKAIALDPDTAEAYINRGNALHELGQLDAAISDYDKTIALKPNFAEAYLNRGIVLHRRRSVNSAVASFDIAIALKPNFAEAYMSRGNALQDLGQFEAAVASYDKAVALKPNYAEAYLSRGKALAQLNRMEAALDSCDKAVALKPDYAEAYSNRGNILQDLKQLDAAIVSLDKAIALRPNFAEAYCNRGIALRKLRRLDAAVASYDKAISIKPNFADAYWNKSLTLLLGGRFIDGWALYEWRWKRGRVGANNRNFPQPLWLGKEDLSGKTILLHSEQGLGDTIQFCRYAKLVSDLGAQVILEVERPLLGLLQTLEGVSELVEKGAPLPMADYHCPLLSLPLAFGTEINTIPRSTNYLGADPVKAERWNLKLGVKTKPRIGLVWSGGLREDQPETWPVNQRRNIKLLDLASLACEGVEFYSLQKGQPAEAELAAVKASGWNGPNIIDYSRELVDFSDTAALIHALDLVISVDTSTAHLAGSLGKPVWILNRYDTCWRWLLDRTDTPWYPSARLFTQDKMGDWDGVLVKVKQALQSLLQSRP